jgi:hypothetical protein
MLGRGESIKKPSRQRNRTNRLKSLTGWGLFENGRQIVSAQPGTTGPGLGRPRQVHGDANAQNDFLKNGLEAVTKREPRLGYLRAGSREPSWLWMWELEGSVRETI